MSSYVLELNGKSTTIRVKQPSDNEIVVETPLGDITLKLQQWEDNNGDISFALEIDGVGDNYSEEIDV